MDDRDGFVEEREGLVRCIAGLHVFPGGEDWLLATNLWWKDR